VNAMLLLGKMCISTGISLVEIAISPAVPWHSISSLVRNETHKPLKGNLLHANLRVISHFVRNVCRRPQTDAARLGFGAPQGPGTSFSSA